MPRIVCHFSCGAASAVATKLALAEFGHENVIIFNAFIAEEHEDNRRFAADCERWFDHPITVLRDEKYGASARKVWLKERFMKSPLGAPCSMALKRDPLEHLVMPTDLHVWGFTAEERERAKRILDVGGICPLISRGLTKADCLAIIERAGIELPMMYRLGYNNANCIGCCKGGMGYWNKIRRDFPDDFAEVASIEAKLGARLLKNPNGGERLTLTQLDPNAGKHDTTIPDCSLFCALAEEDIGE